MTIGLENVRRCDSNSPSRALHRFQLRSRTKPCGQTFQRHPQRFEELQIVVRFMFFPFRAVLPDPVGEKDRIPFAHRADPRQELRPEATKPNTMRHLGYATIAASKFSFLIESRKRPASILRRSTRI